MASVQAAEEEVRGRHHTRTKSAFRLFQRSPSKGATLAPALSVSTDFVSPPHIEYSKDEFISPTDYPSSRALGEIQQNQQKYPLSSGRKSRDETRKERGEGFKSLHKKTLSTLSLRSLGTRDADGKSPVTDEKVKEEKKGHKAKKSKSSTNLAALLSRPRSSKNLKKAAGEAEATKDKENMPPHSPLQRPVRPPIYAQFSTDRFVAQPSGGRFREDHDDHFGPRTTSPISEFTFFPEGVPSGIDSHNNSRPNSLCIPREYVVQDIPTPATSTPRTSTPNHSFDHSRSSSVKGRPILAERSRTEPAYSTPPRAITMPAPIISTRHPKPPGMTATAPPTPAAVPIIKAPIPPPPKSKSETIAERSSRLMTAMSANFTSSYKPKEAEMKPPPKPQPQSNRPDVEAEFEAMMNRRNIPENQRDKLRKLDDKVKIELYTQDLDEIAMAQQRRMERPNSMVIEKTASNTDMIRADDDSTHSKDKKSRPRSRTFTGLTFSKASKKAVESITSPSKSKGHSRTKSTESMKSTRSVTDKRSISSSSSSTAPGAASEVMSLQHPEDFVHYFRIPQPVEEMEVGKLHKLRLILRTETVAWTDSFIELGGQAEIVKLLHRTMEVEWREEHEDQLLHETLLCLKGLCTTALARSHLDMVQAQLFPALIHLIFDEEKKGPSEFTTRKLITDILWTYLELSPLDQRQKRAETLLTYLRDPVPKEEERPLGFVLQMHQERPYRVWCKEVGNVTKEVFWIFLHTLNVIASPTQAEVTRWNDEAYLDFEFGYMKRHFPVPTPPVPTAPYVGSVEWEATNYITSHLFLINGILASLPDERRRKVREEFRVSRWERCMGDSLRLCKEKLYPGLHAALRDWVSAAAEDGWDTKVVSQGAKSEEERHRSPVRRAPKKGEAPPPQLDLPLLGGGRDDESIVSPMKFDDGGWL